MSEEFEYILSPWVSELYIENLQVSKLEDVGTAAWYEYHKKLMHLNQQSILEISTMREETIKEWFVNYQKIPILIHEAIQISVWKQKVFKLLIELNGEPTNSFMIYSIFYHEITAVSLMENILFHCDSIVSVDDSALDLIDYAVNNITPLIFAEHNYDNNKTTDSCLDELLVKKEEIEFDIGIKCISILGYFATSADSLPLAVLKRLLTTHDVPYLFSQLIEKQPWKKNVDGDTFIYLSTWEKIKSSDNDKICKIEGQVWIGLRELLLNPKCVGYYEITEFRMSELIKLQKHLHERVLDQIAPLIDLRRWLSYLNISSTQPTSSKPTITVEIIPQIRSSIMEKWHKKWKKLAKLQSESLFTKDMERIKSAAEVLSAAYDLDKLALYDTNKCELCRSAATKRCSKCKRVWYCGRECQVNDWAAHKSKCDEMTAKDLHK